MKNQKLILKVQVVIPKSKLEYRVIVPKVFLEVVFLITSKLVMVVPNETSLGTIFDCLMKMYLGIVLKIIPHTCRNNSSFQDNNQVIHISIYNNGFLNQC